MKKVQKWLVKGKKNCKRGDHWWMLCYGDYFVCPVCGKRISERELTLNGGVLPPFNAYLVRDPEVVGVGATDHGLEPLVSLNLSYWNPKKVDLTGGAG